MMRLGRTLPVSVVLHAAGGLVLFLVPALSPEALPESQAPPRSIVSMPVVAIPARASVRLPPSGGGRRRRAAMPMQMPISDPPPTVEPATVIDDSVGLIIGEAPGEPGGGQEGPGGGSPYGIGAGHGDGNGSRAPVRPGGDLQPPAKRRHVAPDYPDLARRAGVQGVVILECVIDPSGKVAEVRVLRGHPLLEAAAVDAVRQWVYSPTRLNGVPVAVLLTVTVQFRIPR